MSGTGQKRQLKQMMSNLHQMLQMLGQKGTNSFTIKIDQFQHLRRDFVKAAEQYERDSNALPNTADKKERGILLAKISINRGVMDNNLRKMMGINLKMHDKMKSGKTKKKKQMIGTQKSAQDQLQYKNLTVYQLQNTYFKLTKSQHKQVPTSSNPDNYPSQVTLQQLKNRKPINRGFSQQTDPESEQYLKQKQILDAIKYIDDRIQQKMDYILDGLRMLNYNAVTISESIGVVQKKIIVNVQKIDENLGRVEQAERLLEEAAPLVSKPNCIMNVIIVVLLGILVYFIIRKITQDNGTGGSLTKM